MQIAEENEVNKIHESPGESQSDDINLDYINLAIIKINNLRDKQE